MATWLRSAPREPEIRTLRLSGSLNLLAIMAAVLVMLTSSFDILLVLQAGGNYRFCQLLTLLLFALAFLRASAGSMLPTLGILPLAGWLIFLVLFIPTSGFWPKSAGYCLWLLLNILLMFSFVQLFGDSWHYIEYLVGWYAYSFAIVAAFGIVQFSLPLLGYRSLLVAQWWIPGQLARVNGFSYEPSYFATYLLIGFVFVRALKHAGSKMLSPRSLSIISWLTGIGIVLSSSRMGILFLIADVMSYLAVPWRSLSNDLFRMRIAPRKLKALGPSLLWIGAFGVILLVAVRIARSNPMLVLMFLGGTGISGTAAHSVVQRETAFTDTLQIFLNHIFIGTSLGGVSPAIAALHGATVRSFDDTKAFEGMSVFAEALAASGIVAIIPFVWFVIATVRKPLQLARYVASPYSDLLRALVRSLLFTWAILQFNQNMLRPYVWVHLAVLATVYASAAQSLKTLRSRGLTGFDAGNAR